MEAIETLRTAVRKQNDEMICEALGIIGGGDVSTEARMVRAAMIDVIAERQGDDAADRVMDALGM